MQLQNIVASFHICSFHPKLSRSRCGVCMILCPLHILKIEFDQDLQIPRDMCILKESRCEKGALLILQSVVPIQVPGAQLGSVPLRYHRFPWVIKWVQVYDERVIGSKKGQIGYTESGAGTQINPLLLISVQKTGTSVILTTNQRAFSDFPKQKILPFRIGQAGKV